MVVASLFVIVLLCLLSLAFQFINGFHDTANAVATVIYTGSMKPRLAVMWSGFCNFLGVLLGGTAVSMSVIKLLPVSTLLDGSFTIKVSYFLALLTSAIVWNMYTWYRGLPSSSMHALVGAILGATAAYNMHEGIAFANMPWHKLQEVFLSLIISPVIGFMGTLLVMRLLYQFYRKSAFFKSPDQEPPTLLTKSLMIFACSAVSFAHGSNDGQKGVGVMMALLVIFLPTAFSINDIPFWVIATSAAVIGIGSMIGWERIAKTIGEGIGKHRMTYAQGLTSELVAAATIAVSTYAGLPVSTTQVLTSGVAGGTVATGGMKDLQFKTMRNMLLGWLFTLPCTIMLGYILYFFAVSYVG